MSGVPLFHYQIGCLCDGFAIAKINLDASLHLCVSGTVEVLYSAAGDSRSPQAETACCHHRVPGTHGRLYDILFSQGSNYMQHTAHLLRKKM